MMFYKFPEEFTSPSSVSMVSEKLANKRTNHHLVFDEQTRVWWCYDVRNWDECYFYGFGVTPKEAQDLCCSRLNCFLLNVMNHPKEPQQYGPYVRLSDVLKQAEDIRNFINN